VPSGDHVEPREVCSERLRIDQVETFLSPFNAGDKLCNNSASVIRLGNPECSHHGPFVFSQSRAVSYNASNVLFEVCQLGAGIYIDAQAVLEPIEECLRGTRPAQLIVRQGRAGDAQ